jgi:hypothetical protein
MTSFSPPTLASECRLCRSRLPARDRAITNSQPLQWPAALPCSEEQREGEEAATPGQPVALSAFLEVVPPGDSLSRATGCYWLVRNHPAESGTLTFR